MAQKNVQSVSGKTSWAHFHYKQKNERKGLMNRKGPDNGRPWTLDLVLQETEKHFKIHYQVR